MRTLVSSSPFFAHRPLTRAVRPRLARGAQRGQAALLAAALAVATAAAMPAARAEERPPLERALAAVTDTALRADLDVLTQDAWTGRNAGTEGNARAVAWLAAQFAAAKLAPVPGREDFLQEFEFPVRGQLPGAPGKARAHNVLALLPGRDPAHRGEVVIVGAHMDHVGASDQPDSARLGAPWGDDDIWNGADDNASGTAGVLAIARAFAASGLRPRRSLMFVLWNAEEHGLLGSKHYAAHPLVPLADTALYINMDMIGRNGDQPVSVEGTDSVQGDALERIVARCAGHAGLSYETSTGALTQMFGIAGSDYAPFAEKQVPFLSFFTGFHGDYHGAADHVEKLSIDHMVRIARTVLLTMYATGEYPSRFTARRPRLLDALRGGFEMLRKRSAGGFGPPPEAADAPRPPILGLRLRVAEGAVAAGAPPENGAHVDAPGGAARAGTDRDTGRGTDAAGAPPPPLGGRVGVGGGGPNAAAAGAGLRVVAPPTPDGPAAKSGVAEGDVITALDGAPLDGTHPVQDFADRLFAVRERGRATLTLDRAGARREVEVRW